jgi:hypothetical protein
LTVLREESAETLRDGEPTSRLLDGAAASIPQMVMQKFHNLRGVGEVAHRFYELEGRRGSARIILTPSLMGVAAHDSLLRPELNARWSIVETCFDAKVGRSLVAAGVAVSDDGQLLLTPARRAAVAGAREALIGFQHGRCFYCGDPVALVGGAAHSTMSIPSR